MPHVDVGGTRVHYLRHGRGRECLVLLGGFISSHRWWLRVLERLPEDDYTAIAVDLRGTGDSDPTDEGHTFARYVEDLHAVVEDAGVERFTLVGHSMGGGLAMLYALAHPERLDALILLHPLSPMGIRHLTPEMIAATNALVGNPDAMRAIIVAGCVEPPTGEWLDALVADAVGWKPSIYIGSMAEMERFDPVDRLSDISVPTLVTWADRDTVIPFDGIVELFTKVPGCSLEIWHGVGHDSVIEVPGRVAGLIATYVNEVRAAASTPSPSQP